ncbi:Transcription factor jumonji/aspartyl beta-hydroxylase [Lasiodiplodia theobromae]|nr:Transcription factor jumonji/aspartyl beta-hydroxylase [Lasiodiplodia theobromae]
MAASNQTGFIPHAAVVGGAVAQAHYFMTYEAARAKLRERINESRQEKNRARRSRQKATPITDELDRECQQLGIGMQRDAAEILRTGIVQELINVGFAYDRLDTRERVNVFLKQGEVLCRILSAYENVEGSDKTPARMTVSTALIMLFPGEAREEPELAMYGETLDTDFSLMNAVTMKE